MVDMTKLAEWHKAKEQLDVLKAKELSLRNEIFGEAFPSPVEGSRNKAPLASGYVLKGDYKINRNVDQAVVATLAKGDNTRALTDKYFRVKYDLNITEWKKATPEEIKILAEAVIEKPGTPALEIVLPKR